MFTDMFLGKLHDKYFRSRSQRNGWSIHRLLSTRPDINLITAEKDDLDLRTKQVVSEFFSMKN